MSGASEPPPGLPSNRLGGIPERYVPGESAGELVEAEHLGRYRWAAELAHGRTVLDAGCGAGYGCALLVDAGAAAVTGIDSDPDAIAEAGRVTDAKADLRVADMMSLPFEDSSFALVVCFEVIEHLADQERALDELARVLDPGGVIAISSPNPAGYPAGNPHHLRELGTEELQAMLAERFATVRTFIQRSWFATTILSDREDASEGATELGGSMVMKTGAGNAGYPYTIAIAGNGGLPEPRTFTALSEGIDHKRIAASWREQGDALHSLGTRLEKLERIAKQRQKSLTEAEQLLASLPSLWAARTELEAIKASPSWRIGAPLRAAASRLRLIHLRGARMQLKRWLQRMINGLARLTGRDS